VEAVLTAVVEPKTQESDLLLHPPGEVLGVGQDLMDERLVQAAVLRSVGGDHPRITSL
jgi:hypothetical protein